MVISTMVPGAAAPPALYVTQFTVKPVDVLLAIPAIDALPPVKACEIEML
jgi:hypothetical protein